MASDDHGRRESLRALPAVERVIQALEGSAPHELLASAARAAVDAGRARVLEGGDAPSIDEVAAEAAAQVATAKRGRLRPVVNATGVLIHTNLGRVPLGDAQLQAVTRIARGYSNLEYELGKGDRGSRYVHARRGLTALTGAESALVVNNNAAAVLLTLAALCAQREVIISRGELIEIGGEFRIPDVMAASGARLVEVGTTNRTHLADYERAIGPETAAVLKVHPSNYRVVGFTASVDARRLARLARGRGVLFIHDIGSGSVRDVGDASASADPRADLAVEDGADIVTFSGDKLLGGPQAGVIVGRSEPLARIEKHPLMRAVRPDKMTLAALEATIDLYLEGRHDALPFVALRSADVGELEARARAVVAEVEPVLGARGVKLEAVRSSAPVGGGSMPGAELASWAVAIVHPQRTASELAAALRGGDPPVVARIQDERVLLDLRSVPRSADATLGSVVKEVLA